MIFEAEAASMRNRGELVGKLDMIQLHGNVRKLQAEMDELLNVYEDDEDDDMVLVIEHLMDLIIATARTSLTILDEDGCQRAFATVLAARFRSDCLDGDNPGPKARIKQICEDCGVLPVATNVRPAGNNETSE